ncbi:MAG: cytochrome c [Acidobacteriaceae bacterium]|nr:cytochrome c [Acidobacteriaceae bacterium]
MNVLQNSFLRLGVAFVLALSTCGCKHLPPSKPLSALTPAEQQGHQIFQERCYRCHNDRLDEDRSGPSLFGLTRKPYLPSGAPSSDERITATILHGRNMMPAQSDLSDQELADLLRYLHTL